jgi:GT2 family glycosyltransferase
MTNEETDRLSVGVIIATKGRSDCVAKSLAALERQTQRPTSVVFSVTEEKDLPADKDALFAATELAVETITGTAGLAAQRNRGVRKIEGKVEIVLFIDDDFLPAPQWIERCAALFAADPALVGVTGRLLADGITTGALSWDEAGLLVEQAIGQEMTAPLRGQETPIPDLYGCNMAYRLSKIEGLFFDERLVLYGWMEDKDFSRRAGRNGKLVRSQALLGVHLGAHGARLSGVRYGYSQVANPVYLWKKKILTLHEVIHLIAKPFLMNCAKSLMPESHIDRKGRLKGNLLALGDCALGREKPERVINL